MGRAAGRDLRGCGEAWHRRLWGVKSLPGARRRPLLPNNTALTLVRLAILQPPPGGSGAVHLGAARSWWNQLGVGKAPQAPGVSSNLADTSAWHAMINGQTASAKGGSIAHPARRGVRL